MNVIVPWMLSWRPHLQISCRTADGRPCDAYNLPCRHVVCVALKVNKEAVHGLLCNQQLLLAWFPPMYHIDAALHILENAQPIDCAQGQNATSDLHPPAPRKDRKVFSKRRIRSKFQAANDDTSGVVPPKLSGKKRAASDLDGDGVITTSVGTVRELGNYTPPAVEPMNDEDSIEPPIDASKPLLWKPVKEPASPPAKKAKTAAKVVPPSKPTSRKSRKSAPKTAPPSGPQPSHLETMSSVIPGALASMSSWISRVLR